MHGLLLGSLPNIWVGAADKSFDSHIIDIMPQRGKLGDQGLWQVLVQLELHGLAGTVGAGKSSSAEAAANAITALRASGGTVGKSAKICSTEAPSARLANSVRTGTRVPLITICPPHTSGFRSKKLR